MDKHEVLPGLWVGSEYGDLIRERKQLINDLVQGDASVKTRIREITNRLIEMKMGRLK